LKASIVEPFSSSKINTLGKCIGDIDSMTYTAPEKVKIEKYGRAKYEHIIWLW